MTKRGVGFLILFALTLLTALATGFSEIFLTAILFGMVLAFALVSAMAGVFVLHAMHTVSPHAVVRGKNVHVEMQFKGLLLLPVIVRVLLQLPEGKSYTCADMLFGSDPSLTYDDFNCPHRGIWNIGISKASCSDIFGFFSIPLLQKNMPDTMASVIVYPVLRELSGSPLPPVPNMDYSESNLVSADQGDSFSHTRLYRDGDSLKRIHWKLTVRTRELHTRLYEMSLEKMVVLILNTSVNSSLPADSALGYADMAAECCAALALYYVSAGQKVKIVPSGDADKSLFIRTKEEFENAYALLASITFDGTTPFIDALSDELTDISCILAMHAITHEPSQDILDVLANLSSSQRQISVIFPYMNGSVKYTSEPKITPDGLHIIPISHPRDITERLGGIK